MKGKLMKCKFERKTIYGNQVFLAGQTYDLTKRDAAALGFAKAGGVAEEKPEVKNDAGKDDK